MYPTGEPVCFWKPQYVGLKTKEKKKVVRTTLRAQIRKEQNNMFGVGNMWVRDDKENTTKELQGCD